MYVYVFGLQIMREAVSRLIECCADVQLAMSPQQHAKVLEVGAAARHTACGAPLARPIARW